MPGGAGNQNLLAKRVDWMVDDSDSGAKLPNACGIPLSYDGLNCETILVMEKLLEQISGVRANTSNKPTGVDCDCFGQCGCEKPLSFHLVSCLNGLQKKA